MSFRPTHQQRQLLQAVQDAAFGRGSNWIAVRSGQGPGKTAASVVVALWRCLRRHRAVTTITAPTMRQCKDVWLKEARKMVDASKPTIRFLVKVGKTRISIAGNDDWGVQLATSVKSMNAQGIHDDYLSVIVEEASGVGRDNIQQFKGTLSNQDSLLLLVGNPNIRDCAFFDCFRPTAKRWKKIHFNAEETPPHIVSPQRNKDIEDEYGRDSDVYRVRVLGEFPLADPGGVIPALELERCIRTKNAAGDRLLARCLQLAHAFPRQIGLDFARFGSDESTIYRRYNHAIVEHAHYSRWEPSDICERAFLMQREANWRDDQCQYVADADGMGQGVMSMFHNRGKLIHEFRTGAKSGDQDHENKMTAAWFELRRLVRAESICIPEDTTLFEQLVNRKYYTNKRGRIVLQTKDEYMKHGADSPDRADGVAYCFWRSPGECQTATRSDPRSRELRLTA